VGVPRYTGGRQAIYARIMRYPMVAACPLRDGRREKVRLQAAQMSGQGIRPVQGGG